ncbi:MAG: hypothetical protein ACJ8HJ_28915 [Massilia sp.]
MRLLKVTELSSVSAGTDPAKPTTGNSASAGPTGSSATCPTGQQPIANWSSNNSGTQGSASGGNRVVGGSVSGGNNNAGINASATCAPPKSGGTSQSTRPAQSTTPSSSGTRPSTSYEPDPGAYDDYC